ncbi:hypothetical protein MtrunA17_Chr3g0077211 [Medicago truncatula]|uniref:Uncharacterized protein n=1 Tax=Medicago truncatula TaxID=3880 RepID=A0A396IHQ3_MEDTR|nr:hypothetical protein MtrunA17_Chr3g0077211 [Medicago truncatula]
MHQFVSRSELLVPMGLAGIALASGSILRTHKLQNLLPQTFRRICQSLIQQT